MTLKILFLQLHGNNEHITKGIYMHVILVREEPDDERRCIWVDCLRQ